MTTTLYENSVEPVYTDGRDIDTALAELMGEAADQKSSGSPDQHIQSIAEAWEQIPQVDHNDPTYYERTMLKEPVWEWAIPTYYYVGGLTGASLALGAAAQIGNAGERESLITRCQLIGFIGAIVSSGLLIYDLGRPVRFIYMLRVFRPTSPMNVGAWILSVAGAASAGTVLLRRRRSWVAKVGTVLGFISGLAGLALATYTGVLVANSAVPLWQASRKILPVLFGASAVASVGSFFDTLVENAGEHRITTAFGTVGRIAEISAGMVMEKEASAVERVGFPLKRVFFPPLGPTSWQRSGTMPRSMGQWACLSSSSCCSFAFCR
ncbi:MAG: polysulfide reductase NrfD [Acidobacteriaceae bacterium]|nr:polysulfide reductase NrfD [Acidobacteriaceae bacterium]